ncbi:exo-beta-N-acetylmuramidase NamZ domain-containing protein [Brachybacterium sp. ACRRE]|uniref:exo-beta-N-acetylmuramidase NamZ family protein n=1 Tax=Brachybacterium sp. ACRRE TaxID=2918184 RepID=UPI001EF25BF2|nr:DUF1343 domain-containing protein [Brachybacterium sp. ACRRE]MCG7310235.1 DUF1343 domain-containing protein [Brachybacterium sp. ACRRE]
MFPASHQRVSGLDVLIADPGRLEAELPGCARPGLLTNFAATTSELRRGVDALVEAGIRPHCLIAPEHGYWGSEQAGEGGADQRDPATGIPVLSSYGVHGEDLVALLERSGIDGLLVDLQDIGCRFFTYPWSMVDAMQACARLGLPVHVLDRSAPLPAAPLGPGLDPACASFVGRMNIPLRHGGRLGDVARHAAAHHLEDPLDLSITPAPGTDGSARWVPPSPNMPTPTALALYPGTCLVEGTTWSEGRGTTTPFEVLGAPWADRRFADALRELELPGVLVREVQVRATHGDFAGRILHGVQLHLADDPAALVGGAPDDSGTATSGGFDPIRIGHGVLAVMRAQHAGGEFWRRNAPERPPFIDLLWGSSALREGVDDGADLAEILAASPVPELLDRDGATA